MWAALSVDTAIICPSLPLPDNFIQSLAQCFPASFCMEIPCGLVKMQLSFSKYEVGAKILTF